MKMKNNRNYWLIVNDICNMSATEIAASFLLQVLYVLQVHQDHPEGRAHMSSITEFLLTLPTLSFAIVDAGKCRLKPLMEEGEDGEELNSGMLSFRLLLNSLFEGALLFTLHAQVGGATIYHRVSEYSVLDWS